MIRLRRSVTRLVARTTAFVARNGRDLLAIAGASGIAIGLASTPLAWIAWIWTGGFLLFAAGAGRRTS